MDDDLLMLSASYILINDMIEKNNRRKRRLSRRKHEIHPEKVLITTPSLPPSLPDRPSEETDNDQVEIKIEPIPASEKNVRDPLSSAPLERSVIKEKSPVVVKEELEMDVEAEMESGECVTVSAGQLENFLENLSRELSEIVDQNALQVAMFKICDVIEEAKSGVYAVKR